MQPSENLTEKNQLHQLKLNTDEQVANQSDASAFVHKLIYIYQFNNTSEANHAQKNLENCQEIILLDHVLSTNSIQQSHGFMYRKEDLRFNLFIFAIVLLSVLVLLYQAFKFDLTQ